MTRDSPRVPHSWTAGGLVVLDYEPIFGCRPDKHPKSKHLLEDWGVNFLRGLRRDEPSFDPPEPTRSVRFDPSLQSRGDAGGLVFTAMALRAFLPRLAQKYLRLL